MWICPKCHEEVEEDFECCWNCQSERGELPKSFSLKKSTIDDPFDTSNGDDVYKVQKRGGFFSFRTMVSRTLIQIIYILGMIAFSVSGIFIIIQAVNSRYASGEMIIQGLGVLILGNLIWRILCEAWILLFNIHDVLVSIERKNR